MKQRSPRSIAETKQELKEAVNALVDELFAWAEAHPESDFDTMETLMLTLRQRFGQQGLEAVLEIQRQRRPVDPVCPKCGRPMEDKGLQELSFVSRTGEVQVARGYYYCEFCQQGIHPLDRQLQLAGKHWSEGVARWLTWLNGHTLTYGESVAVLNTLTDVQMSKSSGWRLVQVYGDKVGIVIATEEQTLKAQAREWSTPGGRAAQRERMGIATDGGKMYILKEGWKEFKVGCVFDVAVRPQRVPPGDDLEDYGHAVNLSYTVHLGGPEAVGWQLWTEAERRGWRHAPDGLVIGDGAPWIWNLRDEHFPGTEMLVDWYHATEHLHTVKHSLYPEESAAATRWYKEQETALYQGHADQVAHAIEKATPSTPEASEICRKAADYFRTNHRRMQYLRLRTEGWPIGSGMIESGVKRFKARFDGTGMRWSRAGADNLLPVRAAVLSGPARFEEVWKRAYAA